MASILEALRLAAISAQKRILLPEYYDERVIEAAEIIAMQQLAHPILIDIPVGVQAPMGVEIFSQRGDAVEWTEKAILAFSEARAAKGMTEEKAREQLKNPVLLAAVLIKLGYADGGIAGSVATTGEVLRAGIRGLGLSLGAKQVSSVFLMELADGRVLSFADCAVNPDPDSAGLADIAIVSAATHQQLTGAEPKVALLSFSTKGSAEHAHISKIREALSYVKIQVPALKVDGELQFDAAFVPAIADRKAPDSTVAGQANVYIFPNLSAGNIAYKIAQRIGGAKAIGPVLQGLAKPWMDLSRGCSVADIVELAAVTAVLSR
ncbi:phosphate acetyltransferase [Zhongshania antarctica]|uniref:phosphate acetyltransferase n=1 Tax=Zhongshania antarctica TaxID=641702 RepID=A0A840R7E9_9GAMM|nr:phosphate acetyltransferase [Zhongshania antarctica]MBB5189239.1 phosphate acetyltransferase [Zhongshania antarctica]